MCPPSSAWPMAEPVIPSEVRSIHLLGSSVNKAGTSPKDLRLWVEVVAGINHQRRATRQFLEGGGRPALVR
jgi:hypothetical protein